MFPSLDLLITAFLIALFMKVASFALISFIVFDASLPRTFRTVTTVYLMVLYSCFLKYCFKIVTAVLWKKVWNACFNENRWLKALSFTWKNKVNVRISVRIFKARCFTKFFWLYIHKITYCRFRRFCIETPHIYEIFIFWCW